MMALSKAPQRWAAGVLLFPLVKNFNEQVKAPILLLAGANDPSSPGEQAQQLAEALRRQGGKAEIKVYENEGHGFGRVEDLIDAAQRISAFVKFYVPAPGCGQSACAVE